MGASAGQGQSSFAARFAADQKAIQDAFAQIEAQRQQQLANAQAVNTGEATPEQIAAQNAQKLLTEAKLAKPAGGFFSGGFSGSRNTFLGGSSGTRNTYLG